ncbi:MAG: ATP-binding protein [Acidobacteriota bacterium]|nr:ATP-binding protein [Acidobacteriota bacterium]MDW3229503.1 ATP-binding protein [Acidobacteriota bacterium]MDY0231404.1 ATP-binding protein [Candidatus Saccharicenans sp.]
MLINRESYINKIEPFINKPVIKVISGMRRTGKSSLLKLIIEKLKEEGIPEENILYINKESLEFDSIRTYLDLDNYVKSKIKKTKGKKYLFIDEIQEIENWEKAVLSFLTNNVADIFITGSNSKLLSSDISTLLRGRYYEVRIFPLSFREFLSFRRKPDDAESEFKNYLRYGGLPGLHELPIDNESLISEYLYALVNTVFYKDLIERYKIREPEALARILRYLFDNLGNVTTGRSISNFLSSQKIRLTVDTIMNYLLFMESAFLINRVKRFDLKGKRFLEIYEKLCPADAGLRRGLIGYDDKDISQLLELIVYNELRVRGYNVYTGTVDNLEIDFVAERGKQKLYVQVCYLLGGEKVKASEFGNLLKIKDNYPKLVLSMDKFYPEEYQGIEHKFLIDFLL